jgi:hypothetical protein
MKRGREKIRFVSYKEAEGMPESSLYPLGGFFKDGMRLKNYIDAFFLKSDKPKNYCRLMSLFYAITENNIRCTGDRHQSDLVESCPVFEDGTCATYSYRAWGDLMAAVWSEYENKDYSYMDFYM